MLSLGTFKRGDTFRFYNDITDENGIAIIGAASKLKSQLRDSFETLIADLVITEDAVTAGRYYFSLPDTVDTNSWPISVFFLDVQYTSDDGTVMTSETVSVSVVKDVTHI